ncbi:Ion transport protein-domain-containing protein, partial [Pelagophyceae sp. CCMP2097]
MAFSNGRLQGPSPRRRFFGFVSRGRLRGGVANGRSQGAVSWEPEVGAGFARSLGLGWGFNPHWQGRFATIMDFVNVVLALIFVAEMVIKLLAFGFEAYWSDAFNRFDGFIVVVSVASMGLAAASINFGSAAVSAMRCFRVFRIFKLAKNWPSLQLLLLTMYKTAQDIVNFAVLLFLFVLIFALWGMQAFANNLNFDPETHGKIKFSTRFGDDGGGAATPPPLNFDDFGAAMVTVFGILTGESWNLVMYDLMRGRGFEYGFIFMFATQLILVFCIMNLFLAILLANFSNNDELVPSQSPSFRDSMRGIARGFSALSLKSLHKMQDEQCELQKSKKHLSKRAWVSIRDGSLGEGPVGDELPKTARAPRLSRGSNKNDDRSLCLFSKTHALRRVCLKVAESAHFDTCIVATILLSSFMLSIGGPLWDQKAVLMRTFVYLDDVFNAIFFTECGIKVVATGFAFNGPASYLRNSWNLLDFMIVAASAASYASLDGLTALKALRVVRVIRPLRMLSRSPGLKVVLSSLIQGIQGAVNVTMVCILFFFIFAIMGVGFFKGTMDACDTAWLSNHGNIDYYVPTSKDMCACLLNAESAWRNPLYMNFDTVPNAFSLLFEIYSTEGWLDYMFWNADACTGANGAEMQPIRDHGFRTKRRSGPRFYAFGYHIAFQLLGGFFAMQLFVGVIIEQFSKLREEQLRSGRSSMLLTASQSHWVKTQTFIATKVQPRRTLTPKVVAFFNLVEGSATKDKFEGGIMLCILANGVVMASTHFGQSRASSTALTGLNTAFAGIFTLEAILKV